MTWRQQAAEVIYQATKHLPDDIPLSERQKVVDDARPGWVYMSWPRKAWQAARRDYLMRYGYKPRTKAQAERDRQVVTELPLFSDEGKEG